MFPNQDLQDYGITLFLEEGLDLVGRCLQLVLNQDLQDFEDYCRGEWHSPSHDTEAFPYCLNNFTSRDAMLRVFSPTGSHLI
jgi:hypothetical protein